MEFCRVCVEGLMKKFFRKMIILLRGLPLYLRRMISFMRYGGVHACTLRIVDYSERLAGKVVLVTGGGSGIGFASAEKMVREGARVIITGRNEEKLVAAVAQIGGERIKYHRWDLSNLNGLTDHLDICDALFDEPVNVLINNAGINNAGRIPNVTEEEWDAVYATNSKAVFFLCQEMCRRWTAGKSKGNKKIVNISSQAAFVGAAYPYRMSKWDVAGFTQGIALQYASSGIIVNGVAPGIIRTPMQPGFEMRADDNLYTPLVHLGRCAKPEEIAELVAFIVSDSANFIVGQTILADGGYSLK
jgi:NAD(P)-dependent dehydrogenase (short-subunit alcohol dehydrogenase family)